MLWKSREFALILRVDIYSKVARVGACARDMSCFEKLHINREKNKLQNVALFMLILYNFQQDYGSYKSEEN